jgi:hypothetical protein
MSLSTPTTLLVDCEKDFPPEAKETLDSLQTWYAGGTCGATPVPTFSIKQFVCLAASTLKVPSILDNIARLAQPDYEEELPGDETLYDAELRTHFTGVDPTGP